VNLRDGRKYPHHEIFAGQTERPPPGGVIPLLLSAAKVLVWASWNRA
jgi:hypothetical protein